MYTYKSTYDTTYHGKQLEDLKVGDTVIAGEGYYCEIIEKTETHIVVKYPISGVIMTVDPKFTWIILKAKE